MSFVGKVVLITGGCSSIGVTIAKLFVKESALVVIVGKDEAKMKAVVKNLAQKGGKVLAIEADVSKDKQADTIIKTIIDEFGKLDVLVNNAGTLREGGILTKNFLKTYDDVMNINMRSVARLTYFAIPHLIKTKGNIVNVSSVPRNSNSRPLNTAHTSSKAAMNHFTRKVALELSPYGVRINTISPSPMHTSIFDNFTINYERSDNNLGLQRLSEPSDIAEIVLYIASDKGRGITGSNFWLKPQLNKINRHSLCKQLYCN